MKYLDTGEGAELDVNSNTHHFLYLEHHELERPLQIGDLLGPVLATRTVWQFNRPHGPHRRRHVDEEHGDRILWNSSENECEEQPRHTPALSAGMMGVNGQQCDALRSD